MREKWKGLGVCKPLLGFKAKPLPPKQSSKFKCQIWAEITKKFAKKRLDASSLCLSGKISALPPLHQWSNSYTDETDII